MAAATEPGPGLAAFLEKYPGVSLVDIGREALGISGSAMSRKASGSRGIRYTEALRIVDYLRRRLNRPGLSHEEVFGGSLGSAA